MRYETHALECMASVAKGTPRKVDEFTNMTVVLDPGDMVGTVSPATLQVEVTQDDARWIPFGEAAVGEVLPVHVIGAWKSLRISTTAYLLGTPAATLSAHNLRTE